MRTRIRYLRPLVLLALATVAVGVSPLKLPLAHAQLSGCSTDPVLVLSNGTTIDVLASIDTSSDSVQKVTFTVHAPAGTSLVTYTPGVLGPKEVVQFKADQRSGQYTTTTVADTVTGGVAVTASTKAIAADGATAVASVSGVSNQPLSVPLTL